jgi:predicted HTH transcriptional regulator
VGSLGLNTFQLFSFENYYNQNITKYFSSVGVRGDYYEIVSRIDFTDWLIYFTDGIIDELLRVQKLLEETIAPKRTSEHEKIIIAYLKKHGSISEAEYSMITKRARSTRILDFKNLVEKNILERHGKGKATYYTLAREKQE